MKKKWRFALFFLFGLFIISWIVSGFFSLFISGSQGGFGNVMVLDLRGPIMESVPADDIFGSDIVSSTSIAEKLSAAQEDPSVQAVVLLINSPGGGAVASHEIVHALNELEKPSVAVIRSLGASGAYWAASATDTIFADPLSFVGSIGVTSSYLEFSGLLDMYNITYERLVSGRYKDTGTPFRELTEEERQMILDRIDKVHDFFVESVAQHRDLPLARAQELATGDIFLGQEAIDLGLVDELGDLDTAKAYLEDELNETVTYRYVRTRPSLGGLFSLQSDAFAFQFGRGFASWMTQIELEAPVELR